MRVVTESIKNHPWLTTLAIVFLIYLTVMLFVTKGPLIRIETDKPTEDYVIVCDWYSGMFSLSGGRKFVSNKVAVIKSGETYDCGYSVMGALLKASSNVSAMHPLYTTGDGDAYNMVDGVRVSKPITILQRLDEQKLKFESGQWDNHRNPGWAYLGSRPGCGFPHQYFVYYKQVKEIDLNHFISLYQNIILECLNKSYSETKIYDPTLAKKIPEPNIRIQQLWRSVEGGV